MATRNRPVVASGVMLVLLGLALLLFQFMPDVWNRFELEFGWPFILVGIGALFLLFAVIGNLPGMAVPASILAGIGAVLYWQNMTGNWASWAYMWPLIIGFVGVGIIVMGLLGEKRRQLISTGLWLILISAVLFGLFASPFGILGSVGNYWPLLLVALGVFLIIRTLVRRQEEG